MLIQVLLHTPSSVWLLLGALLLLGLSQTRSRRITPTRLLILPLALLGLGLWSMAPGFVALPWTAALWALALAGGTALGRRLRAPPGTRWLDTTRQLHLPGSWLPLVLIVLIFGLRYATGAALALNPGWRELATVQGPLALMFGALSGVFLGRALGLRNLAHPTMPSHVPDAEHA